MRWPAFFSPQRVAGPVLLAAALLASALVIASLAIDYAASARTAILDPRTFQTEQGLAFTAPVPLRPRWPVTIRSDAPGRVQSRLVLTEDGRPLGPKHAAHEAIRLEGHGRYSHWELMLLFSTSDGSDPRTNGRLYAVSAQPEASATLAAAAGAIALGCALLFRRRFLAVLTSAGPKLAIGGLLVLLVASLLTAAGALDHVVLGADEPKDAALVLSLVWHGVLGVLVTLVQCLAGAGAIRLFASRDKTPFAAALLLGFPVSLVLLALLTVVALTVPWGHAIAALGIVLLLVRLRHDLPPAREWPRAAVTLAGLALPALAFGIWLGLLWHGPTQTLPGMPSGDLVYYSTLVTTLQQHPWPIRNWGNEGEFFPAFNALWPAFGAALASAMPVEPFAFVITSGATAFVLVTSLILAAYLRARRCPTTGLVRATIVLGLLAAGRYPYWVVESIPQIHTAALTIAVWFWARKGDRMPLGSLASAALALAGSALTKVVSAATLLPLTLPSLVHNILRSPAWIKVAALGGVVLAVAYSGTMLWTFGPRLVAVGGAGPDSYVQLYEWNASLWATLPALLRDVGTVLLIIASLRISPGWPGVAISIGLASGLLVPFVMRGAFAAAVLLFAVCAAEAADRLRANRLLAVDGLLLCLPAMLLTDPGGRLTGIVWTVCVGVAAWFVIEEAAMPAQPKGTMPALSRNWRAGLTAGAATIVAFLIAVAQGRIGMASNWLGGSERLSPDVYALWREVRAVVPPHALIFTDQTGPDWRLLGGWNTYAFHGERQLFISTWVQSGELQSDEPRRLAKLAWNRRVLEGQIAPTAVPVRGRYDRYYAVVRRERLADLSGWTPVRLVGGYAIARWRGE